jgi:general secretion pathway protein G
MIRLCGAMVSVFAPYRSILRLPRGSARSRLCEKFSGDNLNLAGFSPVHLSFGAREAEVMIVKQLNALDRRRRRTAGFTLIEILLVIVIILLLAGAMVVFVIPQQKGAEKNTTKLLLQSVATALDTYRLNLGHYPNEQEGGLDALLKKPNFENERMGDKWQGPYLKPGTTLEDPWGHKIHYELADKAGPGETAGALPYKLFSVGPDGQPDTDDDVKYAADSTDQNTSAPK